MNKELQRKMCEAIIQSLVGDKLKDAWWNSNNRAFDEKTPNAQWEEDHMKVYRYVMAQMNGDYS